MNVEMGDPKVVGIDPDYSGLVIVRAPLTPEPDENWRAIFENGPPGVSYSIGRRSPELTYGGIEFRCGETEVAQYRDDALARIAGTNRYYAEQVEPEILRQREEAKRKADEERIRIDEAQRRLDELGS